jgi:hypothetical protein
MFGQVEDEIGITKMNKFPKKRKRPAPITEEMSGGFRLNTDGWSFMLERGFIKSYDGRTNFLWIDISEKKHPREFKQLNESFATFFPNETAPLPYKFGKINNFYQFKIGFGQKRQLTGKLDKRNVVIHWTYGAGVSLGLLKPYYLDVLTVEGNGDLSREEGNYYDEEFKPYYENDIVVIGQAVQINAIVGSTFFTKGFGETKIKPGLAGRSGFYFDFAPNKRSFLGIEIGASLEVYPSPIEIMAQTDNKSTFINLYLDARFGKRWSRD